ncbi:MAG: HAMP domain-containing histidine kinase [Phycisphaerae bacterium]|nr:HAMP domain-containing histidine kinase [Phycisphaerae bacterium]
MADLPEDIVRYVDFGGSTPLTLTLSGTEQAMLEAVNQKIGARETLEGVVDFFADATRNISPCDRYSIAFVAENGRRIVAHHTRAFYEPIRLRPGYAEDVAGSSLATVLRRGVPRIINDLQRYAELRPESRSTRLLLAEGVRSSLTCPLSVDGRVVGLLFRSARRPGAYDDRQVLLQKLVAERLSQAVEKTYRIAQLTSANQAYAEMLGFVSHELRSPLGAMLTEANLLLDGYVGELTAEQRARLERMVSKGRHLLGLVDDYLNLARIEGGALQATPRADVDFAADVAQPASEIVRPQLEARHMELVISIPPDLPRVQLDPQLLRIVLINLLHNAAKYGRDEGEVRLSARHTGTALNVSVWNEGAGWPESEQDRLFRRFSRLQTPETRGQPGTGVGLFTVWRIVQLHEGHIRAASEHGHWAEFRFEIPQPLTSAPAAQG